MNNVKKYLVIGGYVHSKNDGHRHYIPASTLVRLYGVNPHDCLMADRNEVDRVLMGIDPMKRSLLVRLLPRYDGNYSLSV